MDVVLNTKYTTYDDLIEVDVIETRYCDDTGMVSFSSIFSLIM